VLDNVNKLDQLNALCGSCKWFAPGSRIIITKEINIYFRDENKLGMHDLLRDMGREIVCEKSPKEE
jgi:hypothetical protein